MRSFPFCVQVQSRWTPFCAAQKAAKEPPGRVASSRSHSSSEHVTSPGSGNSA
jgi:hypothetical protein